MSPEQLLRDRGLRVTRPRLAVLEVLGEGGHLDVDEVATRCVRESIASTQAVYDVLGAIAGRVGLRIEPAGKSRGMRIAPATTTTTWSVAAAVPSATSIA